MTPKTASALLRETAVLRRCLEQILALATDRALLDGDDVLAYRVIEEISPVLRRKRPAHAADA